ncbi:MAG: hypothetical protein ACLR0F_19195 [Eisenbergiella sp.]
MLQKEPEEVLALFVVVAFTLHPSSLLPPAVAAQGSCAGASDKHAAVLRRRGRSLRTGVFIRPLQESLQSRRLQEGTGEAAGRNDGRRQAREQVGCVGGEQGWEVIGKSRGEMS